MVKFTFFGMILLSFLYGQNGYTCQYDGLRLMNTFQTKTENGKITYKYKCSSGHIYWIVPQTNKSNTNTNSSGTYDFDKTILNSVNAARQRKLQEEAILQQERIAVSQMTPAQQQEYYSRKEQDRRLAEMRAQQDLKGRLYCYGCIGIIILSNAYQWPAFLY